MNLLDKVSSTDELIDLSISILQEAKNNGFNGFGGMCAQATVIINELLFDGKQINFASFNKSLEKKNQYIGHVACLVELNADEYVIFDADAKVKSIEEIQSWAMLDDLDPDYIDLFKKHKIKTSEKNFENTVELELTKEFLMENFNFSSYEEQKKILYDAIHKVLNENKSKSKIKMS